MKQEAPDAITRVLRAQRVQRTTHDELVRTLGAILRPGGKARWAHVRRALSLAGHERTRSHAIALALYEAFPDAHMSRDGARQRGPRTIVGVTLVADLTEMRAQLTAKWEAVLTSEGMPAELQATASEYRTPLDFTAPNTRISKLVKQVRARKEWAGRYYGKADDYLWSCDWSQYDKIHREIWVRHCEGATREEIAHELGVGERVVRTRLDLHRARAGLVHI
jgi:hypothetical protein